MVDRKKDDFIADIFKKKPNRQIINFKIKEVPTLQKSSGVIGFKSKDYNTVSIHALEDDLILYDYEKNGLELNKNIKHYISKRARLVSQLK